MGYVVLPEFRQRSTQAYNQYFHAYHLFTSLHCLTGSSKINHTFTSRNQSIINRAIRSEKQEKIWPLARELSFHNSCYYQFLSKSERPPPTIPDPKPLHQQSYSNTHYSSMEVVAPGSPSRSHTNLNLGGISQQANIRLLLLSRQSTIFQRIIR